MGMNWAEHSVEIAAPIALCFEAITDYETFPGWQGAVVDIEVIDRLEDGRGRRVRLYVDAKVRKVDYTLDYGYEPPTRIWWDFVEGNGITNVDGTYTFEELGPQSTRATYRLGIESSIPLPGPIVKRAHRQTLKGSVEDLRKEAERRHEAGETAAEPEQAGSPEQASAEAEPAEAEPAGAEPAGVEAPGEPAATVTPPAERAAPPPRATSSGAAAAAPPPPPPTPPQPAPDRREPGGAGGGEGAAELHEALDRAASAGREAAEAWIGVAVAALGAGRTAAAGAVELGAAVAGELRERLRRLS